MPRSSASQSTGSPRWTGKLTRLRSLWPLLVLGVCSLVACKTSSEPVVVPVLQIQVDAVPLLLKADTLESATIWATVIEHGQPVPDSTVVSFAATNGRIASEAYTRDGLAQATFTPGFDTGIAAIIAQVKGVRDTVRVTLF